MLQVACLRLATEYVDPIGIEAFVACKLIALASVLLELVKSFKGLYAANLLRSLQSLVQLVSHNSVLVTRVAAVHAMTQIYNFDIQFLESSGVNSLCPTLTTIIINTDRANINLYINGEIMLSQEGGDPLSMAMYVISTIPLSHW